MRRQLKISTLFTYTTLFRSQTYFFRRTNMNALGQPRSWTDHLLWHHAAHTIDLFRYQTGSEIVQANAIEGRSEEHTSELQSQSKIVCRLLLEKKNFFFFLI